MMKTRVPRRKFEVYNKQTGVVIAKGVQESNGECRVEYVGQGTGLSGGTYASMSMVLNDPGFDMSHHCRWV